MQAGASPIRAARERRAQCDRDYHQREHQDGKAHHRCEQRCRNDLPTTSGASTAPTHGRCGRAGQVGAEHRRRRPRSAVTEGLALGYAPDSLMA